MGQARKVGRVHWTLSHVPQPAGARRSGRGEEPQLPL